MLEAIGLKNIVGAHSNSIMEGTSLAIGLPVIPSFVPGMKDFVTEEQRVARMHNNVTNMSQVPSFKFNEQVFADIGV